MEISQCRPGMFVRARRDIETGAWATGLILGQIEQINDDMNLTARFIVHALHKNYEGCSFRCQARHLVLESNFTTNAKTEINTNLASLFE